MSLVIVLQSTTLIARRAVVILPTLGYQVEQEVMKTCALDVALGLMLIIGNEDNGYFSVLLLGGYHRASHEGTKLSPSVWSWKVVGSDDGETLKQKGGKTLRFTCDSFLPWMVIPTAASQAPKQPLMSSASEAVRQISTQARDLLAWLSPAKCFQLVLGNWCQLLWGELLGTSWAVGRWALDCSWSLA